MQRETPRRVSRRAILSIAENRMADRRELHANLMLPPGLQRHLEQRSLTGCPHHAIARDRQLATLRDAMHLERFAFHQMVAQRSARMRGRALHDGEVTFDDVFPVSLKRGLHGFAPCEHHQPRSLAIEPMYNENLLPL